MRATSAARLRLTITVIIINLLIIFNIDLIFVWSKFPQSDVFKLFQYETPKLLIHFQKRQRKAAKKLNETMFDIK